MTVTVYLLATLIGVKMNFVDALATMLGGWKMGMLVHVLNGRLSYRWPTWSFSIVFSRVRPT